VSRQSSQPVEVDAEPSFKYCSSCLLCLQVPAARIATIEAAGRAQIPFTSGILIGIGETRAERLDALFAIRDLHSRYGHIQVHCQTLIAPVCPRVAAECILPFVPVSMWASNHSIEQELST
jgi:hypothetical protein